MQKVFLPQNQINWYFHNIASLIYTKYISITYKICTYIIFLYYALQNSLTYNICLWGHVVRSWQILSKSDERNLYAEPKCDLRGQIWLIFDLWTPAAILDFRKNRKFFHKLVCEVNKYVRARFCPNRMNRICMPSRNVFCGVKFG